MQKVGENVEYEIVKDTLTIKVNLAHRGGRSASGKTVSIASTKGNIALPHSSGAVCGLNVYCKE